MSPITLQEIIEFHRQAAKTADELVTRADSDIRSYYDPKGVAEERADALQAREFHENAAQFLSDTAAFTD